MRTILTSPGDFPLSSAGIISAKIIELQSSLSRDVNVVFATGRTMVDVLGHLARSPGIDWQRLQAFHLDEFVGLSPDHPASFGAWLNLHLFSQVAIPPEHIHYMGAQALSEYMATLKRLGGADLILLGLGLDGHLAYNKAGSAFASRARRVRLAPDIVDAKAKEYPPIRRIPYAYTFGLKDIMAGKNLILLVNGAAKTEVVAKVYFGPCAPEVPGTILQRHGSVTTILDCEAAAYLNAVDVQTVAPRQIRDHLALYSQTYSGIRHAGMGLATTISVVDSLVAFFYGFAYGQLLLKKSPKRRVFHILLGRDSRPTGRALATSQSAGIRKALLSQDKAIEITDLGIVTTPLLESAVRCVDAQGAVMITASHNPIPQNGWKFMSANKEGRGALLDQGSLLDADEKRTVIRTVQTLVENMAEGSLALAQFVVAAESIGPWPELPTFHDDENLYGKALKFYTEEVRGGAGKLDKDLIVVNDYNGGSAARVNVSVLAAMGFTNVISLGTELGVCNHAIEPIGAAMNAASQALVSNGARVGVVYDFDADRGNLVWLKPDGSAAEVSPQNVAALNVAIELLKHGEFDRRKFPKGLAIVGHCASSGSIRSIASHLNSAYFTVETGEVNVVKKMAELSRKGYLVAVGVEGYSGGTVFPGSRCRDGLRTLLAVTHLLSSQKMIDAWRRRFSGEHIPRQRREVFVSKLLETLPAYISLQDKISDVELGSREFRVELEKSLKNLITRTEPGLVVNGLSKTYRSVLIEYSGETAFLSRSIFKPAGFGLRGCFEDGGWSARFVDLSGQESFIWVRGSKTEVGIYKRLVDTTDPAEAAELKMILDSLCAVGTRRTGSATGTTGNILLVPPLGKAPAGWPTRELPAKSRIILLHANAGEFPPAAECLLDALQNKKLGNRIEWLTPADFSTSTLSERRPTWVIAARNERIERITATFNQENSGPKTQLVLFESPDSNAACFFSFSEEILAGTLKAVKAHKSQIRRTRYDLSVDRLCRATLLNLRASGAPIPKDHVAAYQFGMAPMGGSSEFSDPGPVSFDELSGQDRAYFISPHPDDMEIAAGGLVLKLSVQEVPVQNLILTLGGHGVTPTKSEQRMLQQRFGDWEQHLGELRRAEVLQAAVLLQKTQAGTVACEFIGESYDEAALRHSADIKVASLFTEDGRRSQPGRMIFFLPHPEDEHPRHRLAYQVFFELIGKYSAVHKRPVGIFLYLSPWAGRSNAYFVAPRNQDYFNSSGLKASPSRIRLMAARARKQGLSYLVHELVGGFGGSRSKDDGRLHAAESFYLPE